MTKLKAFVKAQGGDAVLAERLGVKPRTVKSWRLGERQPRPAQAGRIIKIADGALTWADIYSKTESA